MLGRLACCGVTRELVDGVIPLLSCVSCLSLLVYPLGLGVTSLCKVVCIM